MDPSITPQRLTTCTVEDVRASQFDQVIGPLADILMACVKQGASVGFLGTPDAEDAFSFWYGVNGSLVSGGRRLLVARFAGQVVGTVQVVLATPANGGHRAEISKLLVHPDVRRKGVARSLMQQAETVARADGRLLLTLDTRTGDAAESLYRSLGYELAGVIPDYARSTSGKLSDTSFMYKKIA
ncbi:acetyltransferase family protein [Collimonas arenae]|uniref:Acetyltransferase family protein n=1 Tax=Collimonas arenae TaxID=279058 RepID=A0A127QPI9_9BURK|nr:N-acetyltransferase [Collimonas arenae]AMP02040.1 acetyltransferase family protein [Collimonas arenae]AMP11936.1 acetyltransferase family protein [Collimonas arenae]